MTIDPREAAVIQRIFKAFAGGQSESSMVRDLNQQGIVGRRMRSKGWSPAAVHRILRSEKYIVRWSWNKSETRRDPRTGRRRQFPKPETERIVTDDESLRIVSNEAWQRVQARLGDVRSTWPGGAGKRGFQGQRGGRVRSYSTDLLSGSMICSVCGGTVVKVSGKGSGYYGCLRAARRACENRLLVRRSLVERITLAAVRDRLSSGSTSLMSCSESDKSWPVSSIAPEALKNKQAEFDQEERRLANLINFVAEGQGSKALAQALVTTERRVEDLRGELETLRRGRGAGFDSPPLEWREERVARLQEVLERRTARSALLFRKLLGRIEMQPVTPEVGRPYYRAATNLDVLALVEVEPDPDAADTGSNSLHWWRRRELNPRPKARSRRTLHACPLL